MPEKVRFRPITDLFVQWYLPELHNPWFILPIHKPTVNFHGTCLRFQAASLMPRPTIPPETQRVFIGIPIDKRSQQRISELLNPIIKLHQDIRWIPANNWHLTLAFLGNKPFSEVETLVRSIDEAYQQTTNFRYTLSRLTRFPDSMGRIIALTADPSTRLDSLFKVTLGLLDRNNIKFDRIEFRPHITLGRINKGKRPKIKFDQKTDISLSINKITLYQSTLTESGSIYSSLKEAHLI